MWADQRSWEEGPETPSSPFWKVRWILERVKSASVPASAALHRVAEYVSLSQPWTWMPPLDSARTRSVGASDRVMVRSSVCTTASCSSKRTWRSEQLAPGELVPEEVGRVRWCGRA